MRIGINTLSVIAGVTGGGETYLRGLVNGFAEMDSHNRYTLIVGSDNQDVFNPQRPNFERIIAPCSQRKRLARVFFEHFRLPKLVRDAGIEVLYCPGNALVAADCALVLGIQSMHYAIVPEQVGFLRVKYFQRITPRSVKRADKVITVSEDCKKILLGVVPAPSDKVRVVHEGVDIKFHRPSDAEVSRVLAEHRLEPGYVLFVSTLWPYKNADKLVRAIACLREKFGEIRKLVFAGRDTQGQTDRLRELGAGLGIAGQVCFAGNIPHEQLPGIYAGAALFSYPSSIETFGLPLLEAMACGAPVLGSNRSSVPEVIGDAGLVVDPENIPEFAAAMRRLLHDNELRRKLIDRGYQRINYFNWKKAARESELVFEEAHRIWQNRRR